MIKPLKNLKCIGYARTASKNPVFIESQLAAIKEFAQTSGMLWVDTVVLDGVSGSCTQQQLDALIQRRVTAGDYEVLVVLDRTRLTRRAWKHHSALVEAFGAVGVRIAFVNDGSVSTQFPTRPQPVVTKTFRQQTPDEEAEFEAAVDLLIAELVEQETVGPTVPICSRRLRMPATCDPPPTTSRTRLGTAVTSGDLAGRSGRASRHNRYTQWNRSTDEFGKPSLSLV